MAGRRIGKQGGTAEFFAPGAIASGAFLLYKE